MLLKLMGTLALLSTTVVNAAPATTSKQVAPKVVAKATPVIVAKADDTKKADGAKAEVADGGTATPAKKGKK